MKNRKALIIFLISIFVVLLDQFTKYLVSRYMELSQSIPIIKNVVYFTYIRNTGAGFGILKGWNTILIFISLIIIGILFFYFDRIIKEKQIYVPIALVLGGAVGNLINRIFLGYVIDFVDFRIWPAFNVADSCITIGALWLIICFWKK